MTFADLLWRVGAYIYNNKQSILASFVGVLGLVQGSDYVKNVLTPDTYGFVMFGISIVMLLFARSAGGGGIVSKVMPPSVPADKPPPFVPPPPPEST